jgi:hypothetical protein
MASLRALLRARSRGAAGSIGPTKNLLLGEAGCRYQVELDTRILVEWKFAHEGWLFVAGPLCHRSDNTDRLVDRAREILATWTWIDGPTTTRTELDPSPLWSTGGQPEPELPCAHMGRRRRLPGGKSESASVLDGSSELDET